MKNVNAMSLGATVYTTHCHDNALHVQQCFHIHIQQLLYLSPLNCTTTHSFKGKRNVCHYAKSLDSSDHKGIFTYQINLSMRSTKLKEAAVLH